MHIIKTLLLQQLYFKLSQNTTYPSSRYQGPTVDIYYSWYLCHGTDFPLKLSIPDLNSDIPHQTGTLSLWLNLAGGSSKGTHFSWRKCRTGKQNNQQGLASCIDVSVVEAIFLAKLNTDSATLLFKIEHIKLLLQLCFLK